MITYILYYVQDREVEGDPCVQPIATCVNVAKLKLHIDPTSLKFEWHHYLMQDKPGYKYVANLYDDDISGILGRYVIEPIEEIT